MASSVSATTVASLLQQVRNQLVEPVAKFWADSELIAIMNNGVKDLWGAILDLHQDHYFRINTTDVVLQANSDQLTGVPSDCFRVLLIEPADTTVAADGHTVLFVPKKYNHPDFIIARTQSPNALDQLPARQIYYDIAGLGPPVETMQILTAPEVTENLPVRLVYNPSLPPLTTDEMSINPVPGEADNALKAWTIAYAMAKEAPGSQGERIPNPGWLAIYATEKQNILTRLTPREEQEPEVVDDLFQGYGSLW